MRKYDDIVVGSGLSGLTTALLLGMNKRKVLLIEKSNKTGGFLSRFYEKGIGGDIARIYFNRKINPQGDAFTDVFIVPILILKGRCSGNVMSRKRLMIQDNEK